MSEPHQHRKHLAAALGVCAVLLAACTSGDEAASENTCGERDWCNPYEEVEGAYDPEIAGLYCAVAQARELVVEEEVDLDDLPAWAETNYRNGAPIIVDLSTIPYPKLDERLGDLMLHFDRRLGQRLDREQLNTCRGETTQRTVERTDGKRQSS